MKAGPQRTPVDERLWSMQEVSTYLGISVDTLRYWITRDEGPPSSKVGRHRRYSPSELEAWRKAQTSGAA